MKSVSIREATINDFENIYSLILKEHNDAANAKANWNNLLKRHWCMKNDTLGYVLIKDGVIEGFLGTIFSYRNINGKSYKYCTIFLWSNTW